MKTLKLEYLKLKKKTRSWLGPVLVFWLIMIAYPLTVEFLQDKLEKDNIIKEFLRRGGLRCRILRSGSVRVGDLIK